MKSISTWIRILSNRVKALQARYFGHSSKNEDIDPGMSKLFQPIDIIETFRNELPNADKIAAAVHFDLLLPMQLPFEVFATATMETDFGFFSIKSVIVESKKLNRAFPGSETADFSQTFSTHVEIISYFLSVPSFDQDSLSDIYDAALDCLNSLIIGYQIANQDSKVHRVSRPMLGTVAVIDFYPDLTLENSDTILFITNPDIEVLSRILPQVEFIESLRHAGLIFTKKNPFVLSEEIFYSAQRQLRRGLYAQSLISAQTSIEVFVSTLLLEFMTREGVSKADALAAIENTPYRNRLEHQFKKRIGGAWSVDSDQSFLKDYWDKLYMARNKIVHQGRHPSEAEAHEGLAECIRFREVCLELISDASSPYCDVMQYLRAPTEPE